MRWTIIAVLTAALLTTGVTTAGADSTMDPNEENAREAHAEVDANGDGMVDRNEFYRRMMEIFYHADGDKNGYLSRVEIEEIQEEMVYDPADWNLDGKLTAAEYIDQRFEVYHRVDTNSDGLLSVTEVVEAYMSP
jgi:Ca2+-binding EF-hand superfamily protein